VLGVYSDAEGRFLLVRVGEERLAKLYAQRWVLAPGGHPTHAVFQDNDLPGVYAHSAALRLLRHGLLVGERVVILGKGEPFSSVGRVLREAGAEIVLALEQGPRAGPTLADARGGEPIRSLGDGQVRGLLYREENGNKAEVECDAIVVCTPPAPSFELARQAGAEVRYVPDAGGFCVRADAEGRTSLADVFAAGTLVGALTPDASRLSGARAGATAAEGLR
jgi:sarcosine oxidase subunit alpha